MSYERDQDPMDRPPLPPEPDEFRRRRGRDGGGGGGKPRSRALPIFIALFALGAFGGIVWYAYTQGVQSGVSTVAPVIKAEDGPTKAKPEQPGGLQVPHQDKQVFQRLLPEGQTPQTVERLLPPPPEPLQPPPAPEPAAPSAEPVQPRPRQPPGRRLPSPHRSPHLSRWLNPSRNPRLSRNRLRHRPRRRPASRRSAVAASRCSLPPCAAMKRRSRNGTG